MTELEIIGDTPTREQIDRLQAEMIKHPQAELKTEHYFVPGMYCRRVFRQAGTLIVGKVHKHPHFFLCAKGEIIAWTENGMKKLQAGDVVQSVNGQAVRNWDEITAYATSNPGEISLGVKRGTTELDLMITPAIVNRPVTTSEGKTLNQNVPFFGVVLEPIRQSQTLDKAFVYSANVIGSTFTLIATLPVQVYEMVSGTIHGDQRNSNGPISIIGVGQVAGEIASDPAATLLDKLGSGLMMLASLNFALFAFNMIPLLPLDGGHIAGGIYEAIKKAIWRLRRKPNPGPADTALLMPITYVVSGLLIVLSLVLLVIDLINPVSLGL